MKGSPSYLNSIVLIVFVVHASLTCLLALGLLVLSLLVSWSLSVRRTCEQCDCCVSSLYTGDCVRGVNEVEDGNVRVLCVTTTRTIREGRFYFSLIFLSLF